MGRITTSGGIRSAHRKPSSTGKGLGLRRNAGRLITSRPILIFVALRVMADARLMLRARPGAWFRGDKGDSSVVTRPRLGEFTVLAPLGSEPFSFHHSPIQFGP